MLEDKEVGPGMVMNHEDDLEPERLREKLVHMPELMEASGGFGRSSNRIENRFRNTGRKLSESGRFEKMIFLRLEKRTERAERLSGNCGQYITKCDGR